MSDTFCSPKEIKGTEKVVPHAFWGQATDSYEGEILISFKGGLNMTEGLKEEMVKEKDSVEGKAIAMVDAGQVGNKTVATKAIRQNRFT